MRIDFILQGKGGVGKSFVASLLAQHYLGRGLPTVCVDTDPVNATLAGYAAYNTERLTLMPSGDDIDPRVFDQLVERIMDPDASAETMMIVDNGASSFVPLCAYLVSNEVIPFLREAGHTIRFHTVLTGGQALEDTWNGFSALCRNFPDTPVVVWINEYFGLLEREGNALEKSAAFRALQKRIYALVTLPAVRKETFGRDLEQMLTARQTFGEADADPSYSTMARQRLRMIARRIDEQLARAQL